MRGAPVHEAENPAVKTEENEWDPQFEDVSTIRAAYDARLPDLLPPPDSPPLPPASASFIVVLSTLLRIALPC